MKDMEKTKIHRGLSLIKDGDVFRYAFESLSNAMIFLNPDGIVYEVNKAFTKLTGFLKKEIRGKPLSQLFKSGKDYQVYNSLLSPDHEGYTTEWEILKKNNEVLTVETSITPIKGDKDTCLGYILFIRDISEKEWDNQRYIGPLEIYRHIFDDGLIGFFKAKPDGHLLKVNSAMANLLGFESPESMVEEAIDINQFYVENEDKEESISLLKKEDIIKGFEVQLYRKDRTKVWVLMSIRTIRDDDGNLMYYEGIVEDINYKKNLERQFIQAQKMEAVGTLAGGIAHDFNNLLMGIQGYTSLMLYSMEQNNPNYDKLKSIESLVASGADLTRQLLGFARGGKYQVLPTDMNDVVDKTSNMFGRTKKDLRIHKRFEKHLFIVEVDRGQIEQVLVNLFQNAWQAMPAGGDLYLETKNVLLDETYVKPYSVKPGRYVKISVTDTGLGMDEKTKNRIFEPFFTTKEMGKGSGLGLASVYGIVKSHHGMINVYSEKGHGTTFNIYFPASTKEAQKEDMNFENIPKGTGLILIVDDEETIIDVTKELLNLLGYRVITAKGGKDALEVYRERKDEIDLVIIDMIMPDMDGGEVFEFMRMLNPNIKAILSSGYSLNGHATSIMQRGCKAFIQKPFNIDELSKKVREVLSAP